MARNPSGLFLFLRRPFLDRLPTHQEIFDILVRGFAIIGTPLNVEKQIELRKIIDEEADAIIAWGLRAIPAERRAAYLRRCGVSACAAGARYPGRN
jgi:hypothetical protein